MINTASEADIEGILECLNSLSDTKYTSYDQLVKAFKRREAFGVQTFISCSFKTNPDQRWKPICIIDGTASVYIIPKLSHDGQCEAIISDVAVHKNCQGVGVGKELMEACLLYCKNLVNPSVYKVILGCDPKLIPYYSKFGFNQSGVEMRLDLN